MCQLLKAGTVALLLSAIAIPAQAEEKLATPRSSLIEMKEMTWIEIKGAQNCGFRTVILPTGGIEQNGPHMILAKHDYIVGFAAKHIARNLGNTLVAPVISIVPEGSFDPPTGNMQYPGTIGITDQAFEMVLDGVVRSLKMAGFKNIVIIGDHGQSQAAQTRIAARMSKEFQAENVRVFQIDSYYEDQFQVNRLKATGESAPSIGEHAGIIDTSELMSLYPAGVTAERLYPLEAGKDRMGGSGATNRATVELGSQLIQMRIDAATSKIRDVLRAAK